MSLRCNVGVAGATGCACEGCEAERAQAEIDAEQAADDAFDFTDEDWDLELADRAIARDR